ncbi:hemin uptake protein HemP [Endothiovibrio diazotrophicus]
MQEKRNRPEREAVFPGPRRVSSEQLFAGASRVVIEHRGEEYRLLMTRQGKLILTK